MTEIPDLEKPVKYFGSLLKTILIPNPITHRHWIIDFNWDEELSVTDGSFFSYQCINQIFKIEALLILFVSASELCPNAVHLILKLFSLFCNYFAGDTHLYSNFSPLYYRNIMFCYYRASPECWDHDRQYKRSISLVLHLDLSFSLKIN